MTTVEIESILASEELAVLLEAAEASGQLRQVELSEVLEPLELDPLETEAVYQELDRRGIELLAEPEPEPEPEPAPPPPAGAAARDDDRRAAALPARGGPAPAAHRGAGGRAREEDRARRHAARSSG